MSVFQSTMGTNSEEAKKIERSDYKRPQIEISKQNSGRSLPKNTSITLNQRLTKNSGKFSSGHFNDDENEDEHAEEQSNTQAKNQLIVIPREVLTERTSGSQFVPLAKLLKAQRDNDEYFETQLNISKVSRGLIQKQLSFNKQQENIYFETTEMVKNELQKRSNSLIQERLAIEKSMPKIRANPKFKVLKSFFEEGLQESTNENEINNAANQQQQNRQSISLLASQNCRIYVFKSQELINYRPEVREGASFVSDGGRFGYLVGGKGSDVLNTLEVLDSSKKILLRTAFENKMNK